MDDAALLDLVDTQIAALLTGGAVKAWKEGGHSVEHMSLGELYALKRDLEQRIEQTSRGILMPIREVDL